MRQNILRDEMKGSTRGNKVRVETTAGNLLPPDTEKDTGALMNAHGNIS
jgi:hypothetical protein